MMTGIIWMSGHDHKTDLGLVSAKKEYLCFMLGWGSGL